MPDPPVTAKVEWCERIGFDPVSTSSPPGRCAVTTHSRWELETRVQTISAVPTRAPVGLPNCGAWLYSTSWKNIRPPICGGEFLLIGGTGTKLVCTDIRLRVVVPGWAAE